MKVGFTGTQEGMTKVQQAALADLLDELGAFELHHGDCIGADEEAHIGALTMGMRVVIHPPVDPKKRAFCKLAHEVREPKPYRDRNEDIVDETEALVAGPRTANEELRSGTWMTVRHARKQRSPIYIIDPQGNVSREN